MPIIIVDGILACSETALAAAAALPVLVAQLEGVAPAAAVGRGQPAVAGVPPALAGPAVRP